MNYPTTKFVFDRKGRATQTRQGLVHIEVYMAPHRKFVNTGVHLYAGQWHPRHLVTGRPDAPTLTRSLTEQKNAIDNYIIDRRAREVPFSWKEFEAWLERGADAEDVTFLEFFHDAMVTRKDIRESTRRQHRKVFDAFEQWHGIVTFDDLTRANVTRWNDWLAARRDLKPSTLYTYHKVVKSYVALAVVREMVTSNPYTGYKLDKGEGDDIKGWLTEDEVQRIKDCSLQPSMEKVRDMALLQYYTGVAYADLVAVSKDMTIEQDGFTLLVGDRQKTGRGFTVVLLDDAMEILERNGWDMNHMTNQQYNMRLKILADAAHIDKPVSSHWFRRSAGMYYLNHGFPIEVVSKILGHSSVRTTQKAYARVLNSTVTASFARLLDRLEEKKSEEKPSKT